MTDKEKVIGGLELLAHWPDGLIITDKEKWIKPCCEMAIALLKDQEAVKPIKKDTVKITARYEFDCQCGAPLLIGQPYCANCGRSVKWDG